MLFGQKELIIDDKSRLTIPSVYLNAFTDKICYAVLGMDKCIDIIPRELFEKNAENVNALSNFDSKSREYKRTFFSNSFQIEIDTHNRILLPKVLIDKTKINKNVILVGLYDHLELWDSEIFKKNLENGEDNFSSDAEKIMDKCNYGTAY